MSLHDVAHFQEERGKKLSKYIKLKDGESLVGEYIDVVRVDSNKYREPDNSVTVNAEFTFKIKEEEKKFVLRAASKGTRELISTMKEMDIKPGEEVRITRLGAGRETIYKVDRLSKPNTQNVSSEIDNIFKG